MATHEDLSHKNLSEDLGAFIEDAVTEADVLQAIADELNEAAHE